MTQFIITPSIENNDELLEETITQNTSIINGMTKACGKKCRNRIQGLEIIIV